MFIDTHCHLDMIAKRLENITKKENLIQLVRKIINDAAFEKVTELITIGVDIPSNLDVLDFIATFEHVYGALGIHPCDGANNWQAQLIELPKLITKAPQGKLVALGEIGLDFYHPGFDKEQQFDLFKAQIEIALRHKLPVIIHSRNAIEETLKIVHAYNTEGLSGVFHCFSEDESYAKEVVKQGFLIGIAGHATYPKNGHLHSLIRQIGLTHLILETDAPFLPPQAIRGKLNTPAQIATIGKFVAELLGCSSEEVAQKTSANARHLFKLPPAGL